MVIELSEKARKSLNEYLNQVKRSLKGVKYIDADEIVQNVNEHIENELGETKEPVNSEKLGAVLEKLGSPLQWVPEEEISWWRKFIIRIHSGPEDWRLAYLAFGLFVAGLLFHTSFSNFIILMATSFIVSRASLAAVNNSDELRGQKWFIYPSLITVYLVILSFILAWPLIPIFNLFVPKYIALLEATYSGIEGRDFVEVTSFIVGSILSAVSIGIIWIGYGLILLSKEHQNRIRKIFKPFANQFNRKWSMAIIFLGIGLLVVSIIACYVINYFELIPVGLLSNKLFF
jgi:hypothetical protein